MPKKQRAHLSEKKSVHENGSSRSELTERYDLIPFEGQRRTAIRMGLGRRKHGARNWEGGGIAFASDTLNHLVHHTLRYSSGDTSDDHLAAILANAHMLAEFEARGITVKDIIAYQKEFQTVTK